ncbi:MAG: NUDIX domain-containing protein [Actinomycetota bacterium]|nr:NUDIX domain-containing protein [Actinomycetota bacterium]
MLVFDHVGVPETGTQVPAGGIKSDEDHEAAVLRELFEESGISAARLVRKLGECWFVTEQGQVPAGNEESVHHAFHLHLDEPTPDATWEWDECDGGDVVKWRFAFRWVDFDVADGVLHPIQAMWIPALRCSLHHT